MPEHVRVEFEKMRNPEVSGADIDRSAPEVGGTKIIIQRHELYIRKADDVDVETLGSLTPESAERAYNQSREIIEEMLATIGDDVDDIDFLVVGSSTKYEGQGQRSVETAQQALQALRDVFEERGIDNSQLLNNRSRSKDVSPIAQMRVDRIFDEWPQYAEFLEKKYGIQTQKFWQAFEEDWHPEEREAFGAESPDEMDERFAGYVKKLESFSRFYHKKNPKRRLVIWSVSHYDTISPYIKRHISGTDPNQYVAIDYGAGVSIDIDSEGNPSCMFRGEKHSVDL